MMGKGGAAGREEGEAGSTELFCSGLIALFQGDFAGADALFQAIDPAGAARDLHADLIFLGAVAHAHGAPADDRLMARLATSRGMLARSPARGQPGFESKVLLLDAEIARVSGDRLAALQFYDQAAGIAAGAAIAQEEGLAHELAARLSESSGLHSAALAHRRLARDSFHRWGAHAKAQLLDAGLPYGVSYALDATGPLHPESDPDDPASLVEAARLHAGQSEGKALLARSEASLRCARAELAKTSQLTVMGSLAASIAHEINQPLAVIVSNAGAGLRWLRQSPPNVTEAMASLTVIRDDGLRAGGIIKALRALAKQGPLRSRRLASTMSSVMCWTSWRPSLRRSA
jgi:signal transduction histidine kinase